MFAQIAQDAGAATDAPKPSREESLEQALQFYEAITLQDGPAPPMRFLRARAFSRLGDVNYRYRLKVRTTAVRTDLPLDKTTTDAYQNALAMFDDLAREFPTVLEYRQGSAASHAQLAGLGDDQIADEEQLERLRRFTSTWPMNSKTVLQSGPARTLRALGNLGRLAPEIVMQ